MLESNIRFTEFFKNYKATFDCIRFPIIFFPRKLLITILFDNRNIRDSIEALELLR